MRHQQPVEQYWGDHFAHPERYAESEHADRVRCVPSGRYYGAMNHRTVWLVSGPLFVIDLTYTH